MYEFSAEPFGVHLYHCHGTPLTEHIHKSLCGVYIVDPRFTREKAKELVLMMNGFDNDFDGENEIYAVNLVSFHYMKHPIEVELSDLVRIYLVNILEFNQVNSFHLHAHKTEFSELGWMGMFKVTDRLGGESAGVVPSGG